MQNASALVSVSTISSCSQMCWRLIQNSDEERNIDRKDINIKIRFRTYWIMLTLNFYDNANIFVRSKNLLGAGLVVVNLRKLKLFHVIISLHSTFTVGRLKNQFYFRAVERKHSFWPIIWLSICSYLMNTDSILFSLLTGWNFRPQIIWWLSNASGWI